MNQSDTKGSEISSTSVITQEHVEVHSTATQDSSRVEQIQPVKETEEGAAGPTKLVICSFKVFHSSRLDQSMRTETVNSYYVQPMEETVEGAAGPAELVTGLYPIR